MSAQLNGDGQGTGGTGAGGLVLTATESKVAEAGTPGWPELTASPPTAAPPRSMVAVEPGSGDQMIPSGEM